MPDSPAFRHLENFINLGRDTPCTLQVVERDTHAHTRLLLVLSLVDDVEKYVIGMPEKS
jgi:hypothetical protein